MKLTLICDQTQDAAANRLFDRVLANATKEDVLILTPENATLWAEETLAKKAPCGAISGITVTNVTRLCGSIFPSKKFASQKLSLMLVAHAIESLELKTYTKSKDKIGFASNVLELIKLFSQSGLSPESLASPNKKNALNQKLSDIKLIWEKYLSLLPSGVEDSFSKMKLLNKCAQNGFFAGKTIYFVGFDDISQSLLTFAENVCKTAKEVVVSVVEFENASFVNSAVCDEFLSIAKNLNLNPTWRREKSLQGRAFHISQNLFAKEKEKKEVQKMQIYKCHNRKSEAQFVCSYITKNILNGSRYSDFLLVVPNIDVYEKHLSALLEKECIPFYSDSAKAIANHPLCRLVEEYFVVLANKNSQRDIISLCKNLLLENDQEEIWLYENFCKKYGIRFDDLKSSLSVGKNDENYQIAKVVHGRLGKIVKHMPEKGESVSTVVGAARQFLSDNDIATKIKEYGNKLHSEEQKAVNEKIYEEVEDIFSEIVAALGNQTISYREVLNLWQNCAAETKLKLVPPVLDAVRICDVSTSKHPQVKNTIIMGACEGGFPSIVLDNGLLTDGDLENMNKEFGLKVSPTVAHVNELEKFKVRELLSLGNEEYVITYPTKIGQEDQLESSCIKALRNICLVNGSQLQVLDATPSDNLQLRQQFIEMAKTSSGAKKVVAIGKERANSNKTTYSFVDVFGSAESALKETGKLQEKQGNIQTKLSKKLFFRNGKTSISELETYFSCPYLHFARYGLGVKDAEEAAIKALDIGNFLHACLEKITDKFIKAKYEITDEQFSQDMKDVLSEIVSAEKYKSKVNALQLEALKNEACRLCYAVLKGFSETGFKPVKPEIVFGERGDLPAVKFKNTNILLEGKIDRMDKCDKYVRLVDYKTGQIDLAISNLYYGKKIQLFAYLMSVVQNGKYVPAGVFYLPIRSTFKKNTNLLETYKLQGYFPGDDNIVYEMDHTLSLDNPKSMLVDVSLSKNKENVALGKKVIKPQSHILKNNELERLVDYTSKLSESAIKQIEDGEIVPSPLEASGSMACEFCPFKSACKIDEHTENIRHTKEKIDVASIIGEN